MILMLNSAKNAEQCYKAEEVNAENARYNTEQCSFMLRFPKFWAKTMNFWRIKFYLNPVFIITKKKAREQKCLSKTLYSNYYFVFQNRADLWNILSMNLYSLSLWFSIEALILMFGVQGITMNNFKNEILSNSVWWVNK